MFSIKAMTCNGNQKKLLGMANRGQVSGIQTMTDKLSNYLIVHIGAHLTNKHFFRDLDLVIQSADDRDMNHVNYKIN